MHGYFDLSCKWEMSVVKGQWRRDVHGLYARGRCKGKRCGLAVQGRTLTNGLRVRMGWPRSLEACWVLEVWQARFGLLGLGIGPNWVLGLGPNNKKDKVIIKIITKHYKNTIK